jgi:hypothetical protein
MNILVFVHGGEHVSSVYHHPIKAVDSFLNLAWLPIYRAGSQTRRLLCSLHDILLFKIQLERLACIRLDSYFAPKIWKTF